MRSVSNPNADGDSEISGAVRDAPLPESETVCGLPAALLVTTIDPASEPTDCGLKVIVNVQVAFGASVDGPQPVKEKSPPPLTCEITRGAVPELVRTTVFDALGVPTNCGGNTTLVAENVMPGVVAGKPLPLSAAVSGLGAAFVTIWIWPLAGPVTPGAKVTLMLHAALGARDAGQAFACEKPAPLAAIDAIASGAVPGLLSTSTCVALVPTTRAPKSADVGANAMPGTGTGVPLPLSAMPCGLPAALLAMLISPVRAPTAVGTNLIDSVQPAPGAMLSGVAQPVKLKSPLGAMAVMFRGAPPVLLMVTVCARLAVPTVCEPKLSPVAVSDRTATAPVPESGATTGGPAFVETLTWPLCEPADVGA